MAYGLTPDIGPMVHAAEVEKAARDTLQTWAPTYAAAMERELGLAPRTLPPIRSWITSTDVENWAEEALPSALLLSTGLAGPPERDGKGTFRAQWSLGLAIVVPPAGTPKDTDELAKVYTAVLRTCLLQQHSLGGFAAGVDWEDERYDVLPTTSSPLAAGQVVFTVSVDNVVTSRQGPRGTPPEDPYTVPAPAPEVTSATATVVGLPLAGQ